MDLTSYFAALILLSPGFALVIVAFADRERV
jgi:hypothetical protein